MIEGLYNIGEREWWLVLIERIEYIALEILPSVRMAHTIRGKGVREEGLLKRCTNNHNTSFLHCRLTCGLWAFSSMRW
jgi:hypothetical protein